MRFDCYPFSSITNDCKIIGKIVLMRRSFWAFSLLIFLVACDGGGSSEPLPYPEDSSESISSSVASSAESSSEKGSLMAESSSSAENSSSETPTNSSSSIVDSSSAGQSSSSVFESSSSMVLYVSYGTMTDERDGQVYKTLTLEGEFVDCSFYNPTPFIVKLPKTTWMIENLRYAYLQPTTTLDSSSWNISHNAKYVKKYGRLYLWSAAVDSAAVFSEDAIGCGRFLADQDWLAGTCILTGPALLDDSYENERYIRGVCPEGWHLPTYNEDIDLIKWRWCWDGADGFNAREPVAGLYNTEKDVFSSFDGGLFYWTTTEKNHELANADNFDPYSLAYTEGQSIDEGVSPISKSYALSVRCVKNELPYSSDMTASSSSFVAVAPCKTETEDNCEYGSLVDERDGQMYKTVKIGKQIWMAENLNYADLEPTPLFDSSSWCYKNELDSCEKYGRYYFWSTAIGNSRESADVGFIQGVCPMGWHLPNRSDFLELRSSVHRSGWKLKSADGWLNEKNGGDSYGFKALPAGFFEISYGIYDKESAMARFMNFFYEAGSYAGFMGADDNGGNFFYLHITTEVNIGELGKDYAFPIRCVKDDPE